MASSFEENNFCAFLHLGLGFGFCLFYSRNLLDLAVLKAIYFSDFVPDSGWVTHLEVVHLSNLR